MQAFERDNNRKTDLVSLYQRCSKGIFYTGVASAFGAVKHGQFLDWVKLEQYDTKMEGALTRHMSDWPEPDSESGLLHVGYAAWNAITIVQYKYYKPETAQRQHGPMPHYTTLKGETSEERWQDLATDWQTKGEIPFPTCAVKNHYRETWADMANLYQQMAVKPSRDYLTNLQRADVISQAILDNPDQPKESFVERALLLCCATHDYLTEKPDAFTKLYQKQLNA